MTAHGPDPDQILEQLRASTMYAILLAILTGVWLGAVLIFLILVVWQ